eukprot:COSAG05_NODE_898_length_6685_cov_4.419223_5_plen_49_part_00
MSVFCCVCAADEAIIEHDSIIPDLPPWLREEVSSKLFGIWCAVTLFAR